VTIEELAGRLDLPRSTAPYRLRRATAEFAETFVDSEP
jgi:predicted DNA binding protein